MSTSLAGLELAFKSVLETKPWLRDPAVVLIPWRLGELEEIRSRVGPGGNPTGRPLRIGILWRNMSVEAHPPVRRGLKMVADVVREAGHTVVDWEPPNQATAKRIRVSFLYADGAHDIHHYLKRSGEPLFLELRKSFQLRDAIPLLEYQDLTLQGLNYEGQYEDYWNSTADEEGHVVDAVVMPVAPHAAVIPAYAEAINLLNYSAVVIPVTKADKVLDPIDNTYVPLNAGDRLNREAYDPDIYHGGPVGVQIVGRKFEEEKTLAIAEVIYSALQSQAGRHP